MEESEFVRRLKELSELHAAGAITDDEFADAKARVLGGSSPGSSQPGHGPVPQQPGYGPVPQQSGPSQPWAGAAQAPVWNMAAGLPSLTGRWAGHGRLITAGSGGLLTLLAFLAMPLATVPFLGSITAAGAAGYASELGVLGLLWLVPLATIALVAVAGWLVLGTPPSAQARRAGVISVMALAGLVMLVYLIVFGVVEDEISNSGASDFGVSTPSFTGAGFWFALIGMVAAAIAARIELTSAKRTSPESPAGD